MESRELHIGAVASRTGVSIDTVRYYERLRLLPPAPRTEGGFRLFSPETVARVQFIKQAQELGLSLGEIKELLATAGGSAGECRRVRDVLRTKLREVDEKIRLMEDFRRTLSSHLSACERALKEEGEAAECPVVVKISLSDSKKGKKR